MKSHVVMIVKESVNVDGNSNMSAYRQQVKINNVANAIKFLKVYLGFGGDAKDVIIMFVGNAKAIKEVFALLHIFCSIQS